MRRITKVAKPASESAAKVRTRKIKPVQVREAERHGVDHRAHTTRVNRIVGQLQGIGRMIEAKRYCPDILLQTRAAVSAIRSLETAILEDHLYHCVKRAFSAKDQLETEMMIQELVDLYGTR